MKNGAELHEAWAWLSLLFLLIGYLFHLPGLVGLAGLMGTVFAVAWFWNRVSLRGLRYQRRLFFRKGFADEIVPVDIAVENHKRLPLVWLRIQDPWPKGVGPVDENQLIGSHREDLGIYQLLLSLRGNSRSRRRFEIGFRQRGVYQIGPAAAASGDPFGLFGSEEPALTPPEKVVVYPRLRKVFMPTWRADDPYGERRSPRPLFQDPNRSMGVRDYLPEDGFRRIHWPATARMGRLQTRVFEPVRGLDLVVCLNASTYEHYWEGTNPEVLEALIEIAASLLVDAFDQGFRIGVISNGSLAHAGQALSISPGRSKQHLPHVLEALAALTPLVTSPFERYLLQQAGRLDYGSVLMVVTAVAPPPLMESLMRLKARARRTLLLFVGAEPPASVPGIEIVHQPLPEVAAGR
jgi:uncharacterized protein (DUF58 family)